MDDHRGSFARAKVDGTDRSLLWFYGADQVHGLYDALLNLGVGNTLYGDGYDLPRIIAPQVFVGATMVVHKCTVYAPIHPPITATVSGAATRSMPHKLTLEPTGGSHVCGLEVLPPWSVQKLCRLLNKDQVPGDTLEIETKPCKVSESFNLGVDFCLSGVEN